MQRSLYAIIGESEIYAMKKTVLLSFLAINVLAIFGCTNSNSSYDNQSSVIALSETGNNENDGGDDPRIVGRYEFDTFERYQAFYTTFKEYNSERFLAPTSSNEIPIMYIFRAEGIKLSDFNSRRYDLDFELFDIYFNFDFNSNDVTFELYDLGSLNPSMLDGQIEYKFLFSGRKFFVEYKIGETTFAKSTLLCQELLDTDRISETLDKVTILLREGIMYAN